MGSPVRVEGARRLALGFVGGLSLVCGGGCAGSSPYDRRWVDGAVDRVAGARLREVSLTNDAKDIAPSLPPGVASTDGLSEGDAVAAALWNNAQLRADLAQLGLARADLADANALPNPNLAFLFPIGPRQLELSLLAPVGTLVQRPWRIASAKLDVERTARALVQSGLDLVRDVRITFAEAEAAARREVLRAEARALAAKSASIAATRHASGDASRLEADLARADALVAEDLAARAKVERTIAESRLRLLVGLAESPLGERLRVVPKERARDAPIDVAKAERVALASRPDLRAAELLVEASLERSGLEKAKIVQVFGRLDAKPVGPRGGDPVLLVPGLAADIPIFSQNPGGRARAQADIERAILAYVAKRHEVVTDVRVAARELEVADGSLRPWRETIVPLQETNVAVAQAAYAAGAEAYIVVLEATRRLVEARLRAVELELDRCRARARLDRAVGWRIRE